MTHHDAWLNTNDNVISIIQYPLKGVCVVYRGITQY
jgi:hypothetical protein